MSKRKVNLESIILEAYGCRDAHEFQRDYDISMQMIKEICIEACRQVLELAVVKMKANAMETFGTDIPDCWDEQSIIDTIKQVE